jgi:hypothetical protein
VGRATQSSTLVLLPHNCPALSLLTILVSVLTNLAEPFAEFGEWLRFGCNHLKPALPQRGSLLLFDDNFEYAFLEIGCGSTDIREKRSSMFGILTKEGTDSTRTPKRPWNQSELLKERKQ